MKKRSEAAQTLRASCSKKKKKKKRRFRIDTEVRCVGAHPPFWPFEPASVRPN